ncbi:MAG: hypothetical protein ACOCZ8_06010 [Bacteroidota bacterium]
MRLGSFILSLLALAGLLPFGKLDAAVLASAQPATIGESLADTPARVLSLEDVTLQAPDQEQPLSISLQLAIWFVIWPAERATHLPEMQVPTAAVQDTARSHGQMNFGTIAINAP